MNCNEFIENISSYIDGEMTEIEKKEFELHILSCHNCRQEYEDMIKILKIVKKQEQAELPDNYRLELRRKLKEAAKEEKKINWRAISSIAAGLIILIISISMFSDNLPFIGEKDYLTKSTKNVSPQENMAFDMNEPIAEMEEENAKMSAFGDKAIEDNPDEDTNFTMQSVPVEEDGREGMPSVQGFGVMASRSSLGSIRKIVKEAYLSIDLDALDKVQEQIANYVEENGGFVEDINKELINNDTKAKENSHLIKIRIPSEKFDMTLDFLRQLGTLTDEKLTHNDITEKHQNVESNLNCLYEQENLLLGILYKVEDAKDKSLLEDELKKIKEEIYSETSTLEEYEDSVILSTINTQLNDVSEDD